MRLLFDENLAERLSRDVAGFFSDSAHVIHLGLAGANDQVIWARAAADGFVLVTKDEDFHRLSVLFGPPPKVIWVRLGNCTTGEVAQLLCRHVEDIGAFVEDPEASFLALG